MEDISLHILDIVENSIAAGAKKVEIEILEDRDNDLLSVEITDDGEGIDEVMLKKVLDPFVTTKKTRGVGLGLSLLAQAAEMANGKFTIQSKPGQGTKVKATFQYSHIDRKPLGDIHQTMVTLVISNPEVNFLYRHQTDNRARFLDTEQIKRLLGGIPINSLQGIQVVKKVLEPRMGTNKHEKLINND